MMLINLPMPRYNSDYYSILHRYPVITKDAEQWEIDMWNVQEQISDKKREVYLPAFNLSPFNSFTIFSGL